MYIIIIHSGLLIFRRWKIDHNIFYNKMVWHNKQLIKYYTGLQLKTFLFSTFCCYFHGNRRVGKIYKLETLPVFFNSLFLVNHQSVYSHCVQSTAWKVCLRCPRPGFEFDMWDTNTAAGNTNKEISPTSEWNDMRKTFKDWYMDWVISTQSEDELISNRQDLVFMAQLSQLLEWERMLCLCLWLHYGSLFHIWNMI